MRKTYWSIAVVAAAGFVAWSLWSPSEAARGQSEVAQPSERAPAPAVSNGELTAEVQRLRAELRRKDEQVRTLKAERVARSELEEDNRADALLAAPAANPDTEIDPEVRAADLLDERLLLGKRDPRQADELEAALKQIVEAVPLGGASVGSLYCSSDLCKLTFEADTEQKLNHAVGTTAMKSPKILAASVAYPNGEGRVALYFGRTHADLAIPAPEEAPAPK